MSTGTLPGMAEPLALPEAGAEVWDRRLGVRLRPYQAEALEVFRSLRAEGRSRFHYVAPPGSGKTVLGLALLLEAGSKGVVFSPNAAIQVQWADRFDEVTAAVGTGEAAAFSLGPEGSTSFLSLTYQSVTSRVPGGEGPHPNAVALLERLRAEGYRSFVMDECHHLTGYWGEVLGDFLAGMEDAVVVGLTATPPIDRGRRARATYLDVVGEIVHQIPLPSVVKSGNLAPYQDLVYFSLPGDEERGAQAAVEARLRALVEELEALEAPLWTPTLWVEGVLERCDPGGVLTPMDEWLAADPDQVIAYVRVLEARGLQVPASVLWLDEMDDPAEVDDWVRVLGDYLTGHLEGAAGGEELAARIPEMLRELGYRRVEGGFVAASVGAARDLGFSMAKLEGLREVLRAEMACMREDLRALVLTDYERGPRDHRGFTATSVLELLTSDEELDELDPVLVTGRSLLVDDDLVPLFLEEGRAFLARRGLDVELSEVDEGGYSRIEGSGAGWGTAAYVALVTDLLERGVTRCLVGTRALLGEGWDSLRLNTLLDLTVVASFVSVNQIRGRSIRRDPEDPAKCANNWDVVAVLPGLGHGLSDLARLERKHEHFWGVSDDGVIEKGLGHVHPWLGQGGGHEALLGKLEELNQDMLVRVKDRPGALARWRVGEEYAGRDAACLDLAPPGRVPKRGPRRPACTLPALRAVDEVQLVARGRPGWRAALWGWWFTLLPLVFLGLGWLYRRWAFGRLQAGLALPAPADPVADVRAYAVAVLEGLQAAELAPGSLGPEAVEVHERAGGAVRVLLRGADEDLAEVFTEAVYELLGPVQNHKYLVERRAPVQEVAELTWALASGEPLETEVVAVHPVPKVLGRNRGRAEGFAAAWRRRVSAGALHYTRKGEGKALAQEWFRRRTHDLRRVRKRYFS